MKRPALLFFVAVMVVGGSACERATLDGFFYDPLKAPAGGYQLSTTVIPAYETLTVQTPDGETLDGAFIPSSGRRPDITLLYFHGQSNNLGTTWPRLELLYPLGYHIAMVDPRGYGRSTGTPSEAGLQIDERAIRAALVARPDVDPKYSRQLGAAHEAENAGATLLIMVPGADHTNVPDVMGPDAYRGAIQQFVEAAIP